MVLFLKILNVSQFSDWEKPILRIFSIAFHTCFKGKLRSMQFKVLSHHWSSRLVYIFYFRRGQHPALGSTSDPQKNSLLAMNWLIWLEFGPQDTNKGPILPVVENCPPLFHMLELKFWFIRWFFFPEKRKDDLSVEPYVTLKISKGHLFCAAWAVLCAILVLYVERHKVNIQAMFWIRFDKIVNCNCFRYKDNTPHDTLILMCPLFI